MLSRPRTFPVYLALAISVLMLCPLASAQMSRSDQVQITPPLMRMVDPPAADATAADLEARADELRSSKLYLDAMD
ncbi:MAG: hypothetical protein WBE55_19090, partial [Candidatus Sulfotelmatobacter sp.]